MTALTLIAAGGIPFQEQWMIAQILFQIFVPELEMAKQMFGQFSDPASHFRLDSLHRVWNAFGIVCIAVATSKFIVSRIVFFFRDRRNENTMRCAFCWSACVCVCLWLPLELLLMMMILLMGSAAINNVYAMCVCVVCVWFLPRSRSRFATRALCLFFVVVALLNLVSLEFIIIIMINKFHWYIKFF